MVLCAIAVVLLWAPAAEPEPAVANTIEVDDTAEEVRPDATHCLPGRTGGCSLGDALLLAASGGPVVIELPGGRIAAPARASWEVRGRVTLQGVGATRTVLAGNRRTPLFRAAPGAVIRLSDLSVAGGRPIGGVPDGVVELRRTTAAVDPQDLEVGPGAAAGDYCSVGRSSRRLAVDGTARITDPAALRSLPGGIL